MTDKQRIMAMLGFPLVAYIQDFGEYEPWYLYTSHYWAIRTHGDMTVMTIGQFGRYGGKAFIEVKDYDELRKLTDKYGLPAVITVAGQSSGGGDD